MTVSLTYPRGSILRVMDRKCPVGIFVLHAHVCYRRMGRPPALREHKPSGEFPLVFRYAQTPHEILIPSQLLFLDYSRDSVAVFYATASRIVSTPSS